MLSTLMTLQNDTESYIKFVEEEIFPYDFRLSVYLHEYLDSFLLSLVNEEKMIHSGNIFPFLTKLCIMGGRVDRIACALIPTISATSKMMTSYTHHLCEFLSIVAKHPSARLMLMEHTLIEGLSTLYTNNTADCITQVINDMDEYDNIDLLSPMLTACGRFVYTNMHSLRVDGFSTSLCILSRCASKERWHNKMIPLAIQLLRRGIFVEFGEYIANLLDSRSVEFVIELYRSRMLTLLVTEAYKLRGDVIWRRVCDLLAMQWPEYVSTISGEKMNQVSRTTVVCPISGFECVNPVVASDGHTYERDSIVRCFVTMGMISPITKEILSHYLFSNYSIHV